MQFGASAPSWDSTTVRGQRDSPPGHRIRHMNCRTACMPVNPPRGSDAGPDSGNRRRKRLPGDPAQAGASRQLEMLAVPFLGAALSRLKGADREQLRSIACEMRIPRHAVLFERGDFADALYSIIDGVARSSRPMPGESRQGRHVVAFLLPHDLLGLARLGRYVNTVEAVTPIKLYRFPMEPLTALLRGNPELQFRVLCRVTQQLRESQRRGAIAARRDLAGRVAMLLRMMEESQSAA
jgi:CRP-like cAMP-binding protein